MWHTEKCGHEGKEDSNHEIYKQLRRERQSANK